VKMPSKSFGPTDGVADDKTQVGSDYTVPVGGTVRRIRVSGFNAVSGKAGSGILRIESDRQKGPFEYAIDVGGFTTSGGLKGVDEILSPALAFSQGEIISVYVTMAEACKDIVVTIEWA